MVTALSQEIKIWMLSDLEKYEEKASIALYKNSENLVLALNNKGTFFAFTDNNLRL